ncbi:hypothetical protein O9992_26370 [Vibrio lentus]|nr:hypothetical protein [Vibrio lentus]
MNEINPFNKLFNSIVLTNGVSTHGWAPSSSSFSWLKSVVPSGENVLDVAAGTFVEG